MKYVSKYSNLRIILKPSIPGNALLGNPPIAGMNIKFEDGLVDIADQKLIELMEMHPAFLRGDIIRADGDIDPYKDNRKSIEPNHVIEEMVHGSSVRVSPKPPVAFNDEQRKLMKQMLEEGIQLGVQKVLAEMAIKPEVKVETPIVETLTEEPVVEEITGDVIEKIPEKKGKKNNIK